MHQSLFIVALGSLAVAYESNVLVARGVEARQDQSFQSEGTLHYGGCASKQVQCPGTFDGVPWCAFPSRGDVCCSEGYACSGGNFCLTKGFVAQIPVQLFQGTLTSDTGQGVDPKTCALANGVSLPNGFTPGNTIASSVAPSTSASSVLPSAPVPTPETTPTKVTTTPSGSSTVAVLISTSAPPYTIPGNSTIAGPTASGTGASSTSITAFTGGANIVSSAGISCLVIVAGLIGLVL